MADLCLDCVLNDDLRSLREHYVLILIWKVDRNVGLFWYIFVPVPYRLMWHTVSNIILYKCLGLRVEDFFDGACTHFGGAVKNR